MPVFLKISSKQSETLAMASSSQNNKSLQKILASKLSLTIPEASSSLPYEFDFSEVFGPNLTPSPYSPIVKDPPVIHSRSHSFLGPSPRYTIPTSHPFHQTRQHIIALMTDDEDEAEVQEEMGGNDCENVCQQLVGTREKKDGIRKVGPEDFEIMRLVGKGAFGKVFQVRKTGSWGSIGADGEGDGIFAMKVMRKDSIIKKNHVDYMIAEKDILTRVVHPSIVQLRYSFQTKTKLYLILDFINGGHLFFHLYRQGIFREDQARLYTAEIVSAVSHLHKNEIVHRDLKPENILMDADGHVVLTDFGMAKEIAESSRSNSICGTMEYMAPEILQSKGHNKDADWWSVGILLYEMLTGQPPFVHANRKKLQQMIISDKVKYPPFLTSEAHSLLRGLLQKVPEKRLGSSLDGADEIKCHPWFQPINWKKLDAKELLPKFKPTVYGKECTANFDKCWTTMPADDSPAPTPTAGEHFQGYTYVAPNPPWLASKQKQVLDEDKQEIQLKK